MQWVTPRNEAAYVSKTADGYYGIGPETGGALEAFHIAALWARPVSIGFGLTLAEAQHVCEEHARGKPS